MEGGGLALPMPEEALDLPESECAPDGTASECELTSKERLPPLEL